MVRYSMLSNTFRMFCMVLLLPSHKGAKLKRSDSCLSKREVHSRSLPMLGKLSIEMMGQALLDLKHSLAPISHFLPLHCRSSK